VVQVDARGAVVRVDPAGLPAGDDVAIAPPLVHDSAGGYRVISDSLGNVPSVEISSGVSMLAHAWSLQNLRILFADVPQPRPAIVRRRDLRDRLAALVPFFVQGTAVTPVAHDGQIFWLVDLYSASATYPLSLRQQLGGEENSYFQRAGTAFVEASTGKVTIRADSTPDPIARSWRRHFPAMFADADDLPPGLVRQRPPGSVRTVMPSAATSLRMGKHGSKLASSSRYSPS
jgi:hypothetical protein